MKKGLLFMVKLPFRILVLPVAFVIGVSAYIIQFIMNMGSWIIGLFNLFLLAGVFGIIYCKDYGLLWNIVILLSVEGVALMIGSFAQAILIIVKDNLMSFAFGRTYNSMA